jgi:hypothetical protein
MYFLCFGQDFVPSPIGTLVFSVPATISAALADPSLCGVNEKEVILSATFELSVRM